MVTWNATEAQFDEKRGEIVLISRHRLQDNQLKLKAGSNLTKCVGAVSILFVQPDLIDAQSTDQFRHNAETELADIQENSDNKRQSTDTNKACKKVAISLPASLSVVPVPSVNFMKIPPASVFDHRPTELIKDSDIADTNGSRKTSDYDEDETSTQKSQHEEHQYEDDIKKEDDLDDEDDIILLGPVEDGNDDRSTSDTTCKDTHDTGNSYSYTGNRDIPLETFSTNSTYTSINNPPIHTFNTEHSKTKLPFQNQLKRRVRIAQSSFFKGSSKQGLSFSYNLLNEDNSNASSGSDTLVKRKRTIKQTENKCKYCKKNIFSWENIVEHALSDHGMMSGDTDEVACPICKRLFSKRNMSAFIEHVKIHDKNFVKTSEQTPVDSSYSILDTAHSDHEQVPLDISSPNHTSTSALATTYSFVRQKTLTGKRSIKSIQSARKGRRSFRRLNARMAHETLKCLECSSHLSSYADILHHCKQHNMFKQCPICAKEFTLRGGLLRHFITHVDTRVFACPNCPSSFTRKDNLKRHVETGCGKFKKISFLQEQTPDKRVKIKKSLLKFGKKRQVSSLGFPKISLSHHVEDSADSSELTDVMGDDDDDDDVENSFDRIEIKQEVEESFDSTPTEHDENVPSEVVPDCSNQNINIEPLNSADMVDKSRSPTPVLMLRNSDKPTLSYTCSTCSVNFTTVLQLKRHVVMCHSEENPRPSSSTNTLFNQDSSAQEDVKNFVLIGESSVVEYHEQPTGGWQDQVDDNRKTIKQELQEMDVIDIENLGQLANVESQQSYVEQGDVIHDDPNMDDFISYPSSVAASNSSSLTGGDSGNSPSFSMNDTSSTRFDDNSSQPYQQSYSITVDQGSSSSLDAPFVEAGTEVFTANVPNRRKSSLNKTAPICHFCGMFFEKGVDVLHHCDAHASEINKLCTCVICLKELSGRDSLLRHVNSHIGRWFTCHICMASFSRKDNLKRHIKKNHEEVGVEDLSFT